MKANIHWHTQRANALYNLLNSAGYIFRIYKGTIPDVSIITNGFNAADHASNLLLEYASLGTNSFGRTTDNYQRLFLITVPNAVTASASGVSTWFSLTHSTDQKLAITGDVSLVSDNGVLKMLETNISQGTSYEIYSFAFELKQ